MKGCREALLDYYTAIMRSIGIAALLIWLFEVSFIKTVCVRCIGHACFLGWEITMVLYHNYTTTMV